MGIGFMQDWKWVFPIHSPSFSTSSARQYSSSLRGREVSLELARVSTLSVILEENETRYRDSLKPYSCLFGALQSKENCDVIGEEMKMNVSKKGSHSGPRSTINKINMPILEVKSAYLRKETSHFSFLMENLEKIEEIIDNSDLIRLERDILVQIGRLGALELFHICLSRTLKEPNALNLDLPPIVNSKDLCVHTSTDGLTLHSRKKMERRSKRKRALEKVSKMSALPSPSKTISNVSQLPRKTTTSRSRRVAIARNESEMSRGVKEVAKLERIRTSLEEKIGRAASFGRWADAAGINEKDLKQRLHFGWYCRDRLLKSTHSLVLYLARNYRGRGIGLEDLLQAGNMGVLQGAERFDNTRGYQFSTYVQHWIRKSMSMLVTRHSRGIQIPVSLNNVINQTQKARRNLHNLHGRYPTHDEISKLTSMSLAKVRLASKCSRFMGSIDQKVGRETSVKFMEITPDTSLITPEKTVMRQHMRSEIHELLEGLHPREKQVLVLRYGLGDGKSKSLEEIGRLFHVTKEWIRKIEKAALTKIRKKEVQNRLNHYLQL
ncbi:RNApolymerase sigma-subunit C [Tasmannia lanceolata]|uniref:RNApolymerase sigma-subunit C n=1 Tax=Tasmannia lanceolata TaxID=3420 RepID=UPI004062EB98